MVFQIFEFEQKMLAGCGFLEVPNADHTAGPPEK
jgi:hypothetical protein